MATADSTLAQAQPLLTVQDWPMSDHPLIPAETDYPRSAVVLRVHNARDTLRLWVAFGPRPQDKGRGMKFELASQEVAGTSLGRKPRQDARTHRRP